MVSFHGESGAQRGQVTCQRSLSEDEERQFGPGSGKATAGFEAGAGPGGLVLAPPTGSSPEQSPKQVGEGGCVVLRTPLSPQGSRDPHLPVPGGGATLRATAWEEVAAAVLHSRTLRFCLTLVADARF